MEKKPSVHALTPIAWSTFGVELCFLKIMISSTEYPRFEFEFGALKFGDQMDSFSRQRKGSGGICVNTTSDTRESKLTHSPAKLSNVARISAHKFS